MGGGRKEGEEEKGRGGRRGRKRNKGDVVKDRRMQRTGTKEWKVVHCVRYPNI